VDRSLTAARLARLLARLDPDPNCAADAYELLRQSLVRFFDWRGASTPDVCADETIDRLARRLEETAVGDLRSYAQGIARLVLLEHQRGPVFESLGEASDPAVPATSTPGDDEERDLHACFERCLDALPESERRLAMSYYEEGRSRRIANRRQLAQSLGVSDNALRLRVHRVREQLEQCVHECLNRR
jgi:DNA-directed RNA polymerase specialized sigma24 family protein